MCGVCGFVQAGGIDQVEGRSWLIAMTDRLRHRGPDSHGHWVDAECGVGLGHRRLAIVELSPAGHQPMESVSGRYILVYNGEIYNHQELRDATSGTAFRGSSDTESLLAGFEALGVAETLKRSVGMFALAVWDRQDRALTLARDRLGEKPLYYGWQGDTLLFGSELKAIASHPAFRARISQAALSAFLHYGFVPSPHSIYDGIRKLPPGSIWRWSALRDGPRAYPQPEQYWSLSDVMDTSVNDTSGLSPEDAIDELDRLLSAAVAGQLMSDVPLGAFLSGGIDSSTIVALMQRQASGPVRTFTIGYSESSYDESRAAKAVADHLGTDHTELLVTAEDALAVVPKLGEVYDEPFGDSSAIPTWLVSGLAAKDVKVVLSGDGGDELFAGYGQYERMPRIWKAIQNVPGLARRAMNSSLRALPSHAIERKLVRHRFTSHPHLFDWRVQNLRYALSAGSIDDFYLRHFSTWTNPSELLGSEAPVPVIWAAEQRRSRSKVVERMMALDAQSYLPDDVLVKVDRASMAHSLETRAPLLDHRVVAFAWGLTYDFKLRDGTSKWILRQLLYRYVPAKLVDRPKQGFGVPLDDWLRGPLRPWAEELLSTSALERSGPFQAGPIRQVWKQHLEGYDWQYRLWRILAYQEWARHNIEGVS